MRSLIGPCTIIRILMVAAGCFWFGLGAAPAQAFSSGSTGANGAYNPTCSPTPCTVNLSLPASGVFNFTTVTIPSGVTVKVLPNAANTPITMLATGNVVIQGTLDLRGQDGLPYPQRATGGVGGFPAGEGASPNNVISARDGTGPGGGVPVTGQRNALYGASTSFVSLTPLVGGSGGAGAVAQSATLGGDSGGGGGGAIVIASTTSINVSNVGPGTIQASGGISGAGSAGGGSGGAIRLVAPSVSCGGVILTNGGSGQSGSGQNGRVRLEASSVNITFCSPTGTVSVVNTPGPVTPASDPPLVNLPILAISSVGGVALPASPIGSYSSPDGTIPTGVSNPVQVVLTASNTPVPTIFNLQVVPQTSAVSRVTTVSGNHTGTFANSTVTTSATLPPGEVSLIIASASFVITPQMASLFPLIDGEPAEQILLAAAYGEPSSMTLMTRSGKEMPVAKLSPDDQLRVAMAWGAMQSSQ